MPICANGVLFRKSFPVLVSAKLFSISFLSGSMYLVFVVVEVVEPLRVELGAG